MNTKIPKVAGLITLVVFLLSACGIGTVRGSGKLIAEARDVRDFDRVDLSGSGEVLITQSEEESLTVETDDNIMQYITTEVKGRTLELGVDIKGKGISPTRLRFTLNVKDLVGLNISGSGEITAGGLDTERLDVSVSGSGQVRVDSLKAENVDVRISGSGDVELAGEASRQDVDINGSGDYRAGDLRGETVEITISGSGDTTVWATGSLDVSINGSGSAEYYGSPTVDHSGSGSGKLQSLGEK